MLKILNINEINRGIACRIGNDIFINKKIRKYPKLYKAIIDHEIAHTSGFSRKDIMIDIKNKELKGNKWNYYKFILTHPSSWTEFLPIDFYNGKITINIMVSMIWVMALVFGGLIWIMS